MKSGDPLLSIKPCRASDTPLAPIPTISTSEAITLTSEEMRTLFYRDEVVYVDLSYIGFSTIGNLVGCAWGFALKDHDQQISRTSSFWGNFYYYFSELLHPQLPSDTQEMKENYESPSDWRIKRSNMERGQQKYFVVWSNTYNHIVVGKVIDEGWREVFWWLTHDTKPLTIEQAKTLIFEYMRTAPHFRPETTWTVCHLPKIQNLLPLIVDYGFTPSRLPTQSDFNQNIETRLLEIKNGFDKLNKLTRKTKMDLNKSKKILDAVSLPPLGLFHSSSTAKWTFLLDQWIEASLKKEKAEAEIKQFLTNYSGQAPLPMTYQRGNETLPILAFAEDTKLHDELKRHTEKQAPPTPKSLRP